MVFISLFPLIMIHGCSYISFLGECSACPISWNAFVTRNSVWSRLSLVYGDGRAKSDRKKNMRLGTKTAAPSTAIKNPFTRSLARSTLPRIRGAGVHWSFWFADNERHVRHAVHVTPFSLSLFISVSISFCPQLHSITRSVWSPLYSTVTFTHARVTCKRVSEEPGTMAKERE